MYFVLKRTEYCHWCPWTIYSTLYLRASRTTRVSWYQKVHFSIFWIFWCKMKITQADTPTIQMDCHPIQTNWCPHLCHPNHFYAGCPSWQPSQFILACDRHRICWLAYPVAWYSTSRPTAESGKVSVWRLSVRLSVPSVQDTASSSIGAHCRLFQPVRDDPCVYYLAVLLRWPSYTKFQKHRRTAITS